jgi:hypothetical protein
VQGLRVASRAELFHPAEQEGDWIAGVDVVLDDLAPLSKQATGGTDCCGLIVLSDRRHMVPCRH